MNTSNRRRRTLARAAVHLCGVQMNHEPTPPCTSAAVRSARSGTAATHETITRRRLHCARIALFFAQAVFTSLALACPGVFILVFAGLGSRQASLIGAGVALFGAVFIARAPVVLLVDYASRLRSDLDRC